MKYIYIALTTILICFSVSWGGPPTFSSPITNSTVQAGRNITTTTTATGVQVATTNTPTFGTLSIDHQDGGTTAFRVYESDSQSDEAVRIFGQSAGGLLDVMNQNIRQHKISSTDVVFNSRGLNTAHFQVVAPSKNHALFVNATTSMIGINTPDPQTMLHVVGSITGIPVTGEMYYHDHATPLAMGGSTAFTNITGLTNGVSNGTVTLSGTNGTFTIVHAGIYQVEFSSSPYGTNSDLVSISVGINGVSQDKCDNHRKLGSVDVGSHMTQCKLVLTAGQVVTGMVNSSGSNTVNYEALNIGISRLN